MQRNRLIQGVALAAVFTFGVYVGQWFLNDGISITPTTTGFGSLWEKELLSMVTTNYSKDGFGLATKESYGFFDDIPDTDWKQRQLRARRSKHEMVPGMDRILRRPLLAAEWIGENWQPIFTCSHEAMVGDWFVCDPRRLKTRGDDCLVYSFADSNDHDFSFERDLLHLASNCEIHVFGANSTEEKAFKPSSLSSTVFHSFGLERQQQQQQQRNRNSNFQMILKQLGHEDRRIDIIKLETDPWYVYRDVLSAPNRINQFLLRSSGSVHTYALREIFEAGFGLYHKEALLSWPTGCKWSFLKLAPSFWTEQLPSREN